MLMPKAEELSIDASINALDISINAIFPQLSRAQQQGMDNIAVELRALFYAAVGTMHITKNKKCFSCNKPGHTQIKCDKRKDHHLLSSCRS